jgi:hypothetical protein
MNQYGKRQVLLVEAHEFLTQFQVAGARYRKEFGEALDDAQDEVEQRFHLRIASESRRK